MPPPRDLGVSLPTLVRLAPIGALILVALVGCDGPRDMPTENRAVWSGDLGGQPVTLGIALHGWHTPAHMGPEFRQIEARDDFVFYEDISGSPVYDAAARVGVAVGTAPTAKEGRTRLEAMQPLICPVDTGILYRLVDDRPWAGLHALHGERIQVDYPFTAERCEDAVAAAPSIAEHLRTDGVGATACQLLWDADERSAAVDCLVATHFGANLDRVQALPSRGPVSMNPRELRYDQAGLLAHTIAEEPTHRAELLARVLASEHAQILARGDTVAALERAGLLPALREQIESDCADEDLPCTLDRMKLADYAIRTSSDAPCDDVSRLLQSVVDRGDTDGAYALAAGSFQCDSPPMRALMLDLLDHPTSADIVLKSPDYSAYSMVAPNCQPAVVSGRAWVSGLCEHAPRFAGSWLAEHCGDDAVERAAAVEATRPREPYDAREDQVLDGALRVLAACDTARFEAALTHLPDTRDSMVDLRSKEALRRALGVTSTSAP